MYISSLVFQQASDQSIVINTHLHDSSQPRPPPADPPRPVTMTVTTTVVETTTVELPETTVVSSPHPPEEDLGFSGALPHTSIIAHAPGWTLFRDLYMSNGTLFILSSNTSFPPIRLMTSTGLPAENTPENIAIREPTADNMDYITPENAARRWGSIGNDNKHRVWSVKGNTVSAITILAISCPHAPCLQGAVQ